MLNNNSIVDRLDITYYRRYMLEGEGEHFPTTAEQYQPCDPTGAAERILLPMLACLLAWGLTALSAQIGYITP